MGPRTVAALSVLVGLTTTVALGGCGGNGPSGLCAAGKGSSWVMQQAGGILHIHYGSGTDYPEYAALHLDSSFLRMVPTRTSIWGASVVTMPAFWTGGKLLQGAPVKLGQRSVVDGNLLVPFTGKIGGLGVRATIRFSPPANGRVQALVRVNTSGSPMLDPGHPGERFKPVMFSSMHESATVWDVRSATAGGRTYQFPASGWIIQPPVAATHFSLRGGASTWNANAPTVAITLSEGRQITGWVTPSDDPNDENIAFWAASDTILRSWRYTIVAKSAN